MALNDEKIDNLLDENIDLMININNCLEESDKKLDSIDESNSIISSYNLKNWNILNRISNIWNRFFYYKEKELKLKNKPIQMHKINTNNLSFSIDKEKSLEYSNESINLNKINYLNYYSKKVSKKIDEQNNFLKKITPKIEDTKNKLKINNSFIKKL